MPTLLADGEQTATINTEHTLATDISNDTYVLVVDANAMANGDVVELRLKTKARSGGTSRLAYLATYSNVQSDPIKYSVPVPANIECQATLKQTAGTGRTFSWALLGLE